MKKILLSISLVGAMFASSLEISNPYVKITPPNAKNSAIFMQIKNTSDKDIKLIDAKCDYAKNTEIHTHIHENGMMKMVRIPYTLVPAKGTLELKPKSYHVMLLGIPKGISKNTKLDLELSFDNGEKIQLKDIPAKSVIPMKH